jgi:RND family efflux transporter MFP subunit
MILAPPPVRPPGIVFLILAALLLLGPGLTACGGDDAGDASAPDSAGNGDSVASAGDGDSGDPGDAEDSSAKKPAVRTVTVDAAKVVEGDLVIPVIAEGSIRARASGEVRSEIAGRIDRLHVGEGARVSKGQKIAQLDAREYRVALAEARSQYLEALGRIAVDEETLDSRSVTDKLTEDLAELEGLLERGAISRMEYQERQLDLEVEAVKQGAYRGELVEVRSGLAAARAAKERAELDLERTEILAPFSGVVSGLDLTAGQRVGVNETICTLVDNENLEARVAVLESDLRGLEVGRPVRLEIPALGDTLHVTVDVMSPRIDPESRTCDLLIRFKNPDGRVRPGMFVRASIAGTIYPERLQVPREAILTRDGRPLLFKIDDDTAKWVYVQLGTTNDRMVEIQKILQGGPLEPGTLVVVSDHLTLTHNAKVKVRDVHEPVLAFTTPPSGS